MSLELQLRNLRFIDITPLSQRQIDEMDLYDVKNKLNDCDSEIRQIESTFITVECKLNCTSDATDAYNLREIRSRLFQYERDVKNYRAALQKRLEYLLLPHTPPQAAAPTPQTPVPDLSPEDERYVRCVLVVSGALLINSIRIFKKIWGMGCFAVEHWLAAACFSIIALSVLYLLNFFYCEFADYFKIPQKEKTWQGKLFRFLLTATAVFLFCYGFKVQYLRGENIFSMFYSASLRILIFLMPGLMIRLLESIVILFQPKVWKNKRVTKHLLKTSAVLTGIAAATVILGIVFKGLPWCLAEFSILNDILCAAPHSIIAIFSW